MEQQTDYHKVLSFANQNPACHLATIDGDQARVRGMLMWYADETGFYFHTGSVKRLSKQLKKHPKVEIAFLNPGTPEKQDSQELRVCGTAEIVKDKALEERLITERPWLKALEAVAPESELVIFRIVKAEAHIWDMSVNLREDTIPRVVMN